MLFVFAGCTTPSEWHKTFVFGTVCRVRFFERVPASLQHAVFSRLRELDDIFSVTRSGTSLAVINQNAGIAPVPAPREVLTVLSRALYFAEQTTLGNKKAAFDPTIGPLAKLWNIGTEDEHIPKEAEIRTALAHVDWREVEINMENQTVFLKKPGMMLDLGAVVKGYAADEAVRILEDAGVSRALLDFGGNIYALGSKSYTSNFQIGIQDPRAPRGVYKGILEVHDTSLVTSGDYERFFEIDNTRYHHILSTETGWPVSNGIRSVTIIMDSSMDADALSTSVFALGYEKGSELLSNFPDAGSIFVFDDGSVVVSDSLREIYTSSTPETVGSANLIIGNISGSTAL
jgi:thiamine biosynthesis lipoprotein